MLPSEKTVNMASLLSHFMNFSAPSQCQQTLAVQPQPGFDWSQTVPEMKAKMVEPISTKESVLPRPMVVANTTQMKCGPWNPEEDSRLSELVGIVGPNLWAEVARRLGHRTGKQCRERYLNNLDPSISRLPWTPEEDQQLIQLHQELGNAWACISRKMPGRPYIAVKNRWYGTLSPRLARSEAFRLKRGPPGSDSGSKRSRSDP